MGKRAVHEPAGLLGGVRRHLGPRRRVQAVLQDVLGRRRAGVGDQAGSAQGQGRRHRHSGLPRGAGHRRGRRLLHGRAARASRGGLLASRHRGVPGLARRRRPRDQRGGRQQGPARVASDPAGRRGRGLGVQGGARHVCVHHQARALRGRARLDREEGGVHELSPEVLLRLRGALRRHDGLSGRGLLLGLHGRARRLQDQAGPHQEQDQHLDHPEHARQEAAAVALADPFQGRSEEQVLPRLWRCDCIGSSAAQRPRFLLRAAPRRSRRARPTHAAAGQKHRRPRAAALPALVRCSWVALPAQERTAPTGGHAGFVRADSGTGPPSGRNSPLLFVSVACMKMPCQASFNSLLLPHQKPWRPRSF
mmetsp:Transcript_27416/g.87138  ORF Transcript_27416/g.87138 Transcript_27416/m.87138 type:complete len:364 (+) Transcript_27416:1170-2261(+)